MSTDVFGDLREWGTVLQTLGDLRNNGALDEHQHGLARLIRCRTNWRLQEEALVAAAEVGRPSPQLVSTALNLLQNHDEILDNRILAANALGSMLEKCRSLPPEELSIDEVLTRMNYLAADGGPPVLQGAVRKACEQATPSC